jgi:hypothetical protein
MHAPSKLLLAELCTPTTLGLQSQPCRQVTVQQLAAAAGQMGSGCLVNLPSIRLAPAPAGQAGSCCHVPGPAIRNCRSTRDPGRNESSRTKIPLVARGGCFGKQGM